jgi:hypothetical protein
MVGCVAIIPGGRKRATRVAGRTRRAGSPARDPLILIDPLVPPKGSRDRKRFWKALDKDVRQAGSGVAIFIANEYHSRSAKEIFDRYRSRPGASIWAHRRAAARLSLRVTHRFTAKDPLPGGLVACEINTLGPGETVLFLPAHGALVVADALIGTVPGHVRVVPRSWAPKGKSAGARYRKRYRAELRQLLALPFTRILVSHGPPVLRSGRRALEEALDAPAWGD